MKYHSKNIESLVSGNIRVDGKVYTPREAENAFKGNQGIRDAVNRAWNYHLMAMEHANISWVDTVLSNL